MGKPAAILILSDVHYASEAEKARAGFEAAAVGNPLLRVLIGAYRKYIWLRDPLAHNDLLRHVLAPPLEPDLVVANGDYSCDSAFIGLADPAARQSAAECLTLLRDRFPRVLATFGDHELGKTSLAGGKGGLRLASWHACRDELGLEPFWTHRVGKYVFMGVVSTLLALPVYQVEALADELRDWREIRAEHLARIKAAFENLAPGDKVILFCHDPTALPFLHDESSVRERLNQVERTVIGHLHAPLLLWQSRLLAGLPPIRWCGTAIARMTAALHQAKKWEKFNLLLCPSLAGIELNKRGGYYLLHLDPEGSAPPRFQFQPIPRG